MTCGTAFTRFSENLTFDLDVELEYQFGKSRQNLSYRIDLTCDLDLKVTNIQPCVRFLGDVPKKEVMWEAFSLKGD